MYQQQHLLFNKYKKKSPAALIFLWHNPQAIILTFIHQTNKTPTSKRNVFSLEMGLKHMAHFFPFKGLGVKYPSKQEDPCFALILDME